MLRQFEDEFNLGLTAGYCQRLKLTQDNAPVIGNYLNVLKNEIHLSDSYKKINLMTLTYLSRFHSNKKFKEMEKQDILSFLNSFRKNEAIDPLHSSLATYNLHLVVITRFFKWIYYPNLLPRQRPKPACVDMPTLKRKEKSIYKPTDLWTQEDDILFFKYCPSKRDRCYHAISRDSSCRPHELLKIRIKDIVFKMVGERQYAEILVNGKTGQRSIPLINSIPYLKDWLDDHPQRGNENAFLMCGFNKSLGRAIRIETLNRLYHGYKKDFFPKLLQDPSVSDDDKAKIQELLKKPWNPYIRRHSALTEKSKYLKENVLRQHAGWSPTSNMQLKYVHYFGNESNESILEAYGLKSKLEQIDKLKPKSCPNCQEPNKIDSKFCSKCRMVLSYDSYTELMQEKQESFTEKYDRLFEKLDAKIEGLQREFCKNNTMVGRAGSTEDEWRPMTDEEIEQEIQWNRQKRNLTRRSEKRMMQELENEKS